jgi:hypothetical protein
MLQEESAIEHVATTMTSWTRRSAPMKRCPTLSLASSLQASTLHGATLSSRWGALQLTRRQHRPTADAGKLAPREHRAAARAERDGRLAVVPSPRQRGTKGALQENQGQLAHCRTHQ